MKKYKVSIFILIVYLIIFAGALCACGQEFDPSLAVVRIESHGASGTVIESNKKRTLILSCAHMFTSNGNKPSQRLLKKHLKIDGPVQPKAKKILVKPRLLQYDFNLDLSLIELANGPFYTTAVAPQGRKPNRHLWSIGYDEMQWPVTKREAEYLYSVGNVTFTKQRPWHGRSGGALVEIDVNENKSYLFGVVQGYETEGYRRGIYVSHQAILTFLAKYYNRKSPPLQPSPIQRYGLHPHATPYFCPPIG